MIEVSKLVPGAVVKTRSGGVLTIRENNPRPEGWRYCRTIKFEGIGAEFSYAENGETGCSATRESPIDIVAVMATPLSWQNAKFGQAFQREGDLMIWYFIGRHPLAKNYVVMGRQGSAGRSSLFLSDSFSPEAQTFLSRLPSKDLVHAD